MESNWRYNVPWVGLSGWKWSASSLSEHWSLVAELVTPFVLGGRVWTHTGRLTRSGAHRFFFISLTTNGCAEWFEFYNNGGDVWPPGTPPVVPD